MPVKPDKYTRNLVALLKQQSNPSRAQQQKKYLRNQFSFLGLSHPELQKQINQFVQAEGLPAIKDLDEVCKIFFAYPEREFHHTAIRISEKLYKSVPSDHIFTLKWMITHHSWWDTVDHLAKLVGLHLKQYPEVKNATAYEWIKDENIWLNRVAIIFQLSYKNETDEALLFDMISTQAGSQEFFIQKACGWALRQYSKINAMSVIKFIQANKLPKLTIWEGMKYLNMKNKKQ